MFADYAMTAAEIDDAIRNGPLLQEARAIRSKYDGIYTALSQEKKTQVKATEKDFGRKPFRFLVLPLSPVGGGMAFVDAWKYRKVWGDTRNGMPRYAALMFRCAAIDPVGKHGREVLEKIRLAQEADHR